MSTFSTCALSAEHCIESVRLFDSQLLKQLAVTLLICLLDKKSLHFWRIPPVSLRWAVLLSHHAVIYVKLCRKP